MSIVIDLILVAIIALTAFVSYRYGFVRTLVEVIGFVIIMIVINAVSLPIAGGIYDKYVDEKIVEATKDITIDTEDSGEEFWNSLPEFIRNNSGILGLKRETIIETFDNYVKNGITETASKTSQELIKPIVVKPISLIVSLLLFFVCNPIIHFIARLINGVVAKSFVGGLNAKLGLVIGLPKGIIFAVAFVIFLLMLVSLYPSGVWIFNKEAVDKSYIVGIISKYLPKKGILEFLLKP